jgi:hypothetical protein
MARNYTIFSLLLPDPFLSAVQLPIRSEMHKELRTLVWLRKCLCETHNVIALNEGADNSNINDIPEDVFVSPAFIKRMMNITKQIRNIRSMPIDTEQEKEAAIDALQIVQVAIENEARTCEW